MPYKPKVLARLTYDRAKLLCFFNLDAGKCKACGRSILLLPRQKVVSWCAAGCGGYIWDADSTYYWVTKRPFINAQAEAKVYNFASAYGGGGALKTFGWGQR